MPKKPAAKKTAVKSAKKRSSKSNHPGTYTTPSGNVSLQVPPFWMFRQTNDDLQLVSPSGEVSLIVNAYAGTNGHGKLDARQYLDHLLQSAPRESRVKREKASPQRASARYRDTDGTSWCVEFVTDGKTLLLAEISSTDSLASAEGKIAVATLDSVRIKPSR